MKTTNRTLAFAILAVLAVSFPAQAGNLPFNTINGFEPPQTLGSQPVEFHDGDTDWVGEITVVASPTDGVPVGASGGTQFAKAAAGPDDSYGDPGFRNGPFGHVGASQAYPPISADRYSFVLDLYTQSAPGAAGNVVWQTGINDSDDTGPGDIVMTEAGFNITPGAGTWSFAGRLPGGPAAITLAADTWYTLEVEWDRSGTDVMATTNIWAQGTRGIGSPLYTATGAPDDDRFGGTQAAPSAEMGGPRYSWFTVWDNDTVDALYIDNSGTVGIPEPATLALAALAAPVLVCMNRRYLRRA